jgi:hypothetical protein
VTTPDQPPKILISGPAAPGQALAEHLRETKNAIVELIQISTINDSVPDEIDVAIASLADDRFEGLGLAAALNVQQPWVESVFWFDARTGTAAAAAAASLGMTRVLTFEDLITWVGAALESLVGVARARRALMRAQREMPPLPVREPQQVFLPLPEAERRFREIYLRRILFESPHYTVAAQRAGVPYTTLCSMLKKLSLP